MAGENNNPQQLSRKQIVDLYKAGPEAMVSLVEYLQESIQRLSKRIHALELQVNKSKHSHLPRHWNFMKLSAKLYLWPGMKVQIGL